MTRLMTSLLHSDFIRDERGSATIEILLWLPFFLFLVFLTVDASMLYWRYGEMYNVARDVARSISGRTLGTSSSEINTFVTNRLQSNFNATASLSPGGTIVTVNVTRGSAPLTTFSVFESIVGATIAARVVMVMEPPPGSLSDGTFGGIELPPDGEEILP